MPKQTTYSTNLQKKLDAGEHWRFHFQVDDEVTKKIIEEEKKSEFRADYGDIMNARLRKAYGLPKKKH